MMNRQFCMCRCFFTHNIFLKQYKCHVIYENREQFLDEFSQLLKEKGCQNPEELIPEITNEVKRRENLQEESIARAKQIQASYKPLHPEVYDLQRTFLDTDFVSLCMDAKSGVSILPRLEKIGEHIYSFPVFTSTFCDKLLEEMRHFEASQFPKGRPNTMNKYGILLSELGFGDRLIKDLRENYLDPLSRALFPEWCGNSLDSDKTFIVKYKMTEDLDLDRHFDNAEITLNVALTRPEEYDGGELYFGGMAGTDSDESYGYNHRFRWGLLHRGRQYHGALPLTHGERYNFITWMRSSDVRNELCPMCSQKPSLVPVSNNLKGDGFTQQTCTAF